MSPDASTPPGYLRLHATGELAARARAATARLARCDLCPRRCRADRRSVLPRGAACGVGARAVVHAAFPHTGEERCLSGRAGSGTVFFRGCNLQCAHSQNWRTGEGGEGREVSAEALAEVMLELQGQGCHNVNLVSPSHVVAQVLEAVTIAAEHGLRLPLVYNTGGYDSLEALALLDGVVDIYMPDMKYADAGIARRCSSARDYWPVNQAAVREMHRQVGDLVLDDHGLARRGLLVRHLVLPGGLAATETVLAFLAREISRETYVNLMDQYRPCHRARAYPPLDRPITSQEFGEAVATAHRLGLRRLDHEGGRR